MACFLSPGSASDSDSAALLNSTCKHQGNSPEPCDEQQISEVGLPCCLI